jgi:hypothetical protein
MVSRWVTREVPWNAGAPFVSGSGKRSQVARAPIASQRVRSKEVCVQPDAGNPRRDKPCVLPRRHAPCRATATGEQKLARFLAGDPYIVLDHLAGLLRQFEPDGLPGLLLSHLRPINCVPARSDILDFEGDDIAPTQLTVDGQIEHRQVARSLLDL